VAQSPTPARLFQNHFWPLLQTVPSQQKELQSPCEGCAPAGRPHRRLTHSYRLTCNQPKDHGAIIYLSLRNTKHLILNTRWETAVAGRRCCISTNRRSSQRGRRRASAACALLQRHYRLHTTSMANKPLLPEDIHPESQCQTASRHGTQKHLAQFFPQLNKHPSLPSTFLHRNSSETSMWFWRKELPLFLKQVKKALKIPSTKNIK